MSVLRTVVVDDEPLARERLERLLREAGCEVLAVLNDGPSLLEWVASNPPVDALFVDIQMPGPNGLEVLAELKNPPPVIFVTAYQEYAIQAFEVEAVDYLLKPVFEERLQKTLQRLQAQQVQKLSDAQFKALHRIEVKAGKGRVLLRLDMVTHFERQGDRVTAFRGRETFPTHWKSLTEVERAFPGAGLVRIQRNILLRPEAVVGFQERWPRRLKVRVSDGVELEVSRTAAKEFRARLGP
jgi:DNA-binding LytR/AlgR family response regulator